MCIRDRLKAKGYAPDHILMVGDAPGDRDAARKNGVLFYPILVRHEADSWAQFTQKALPSLLDGSYPHRQAAPVSYTHLDVYKRQATAP